MPAHGRAWPCGTVAATTSVQVRALDQAKKASAGSLCHPTAPRRTVRGGASRKEGAGREDNLTQLRLGGLHVDACPADPRRGDAAADRAHRRSDRGGHPPRTHRPQPADHTGSGRPDRRAARRDQLPRQPARRRRLARAVGARGRRAPRTRHRPPGVTGMVAFCQSAPTVSSGTPWSAACTRSSR